jgi:hypothetical protein
VKAEPSIKPEPSTPGSIKRARAASGELSVPKRNIIIRMQAKAMTAPVEEDDAGDRAGADADALGQAD